jgi:dienelactone hydrolase
VSGARGRGVRLLGGTLLLGAAFLGALTIAADGDPKAAFQSRKGSLASVRVRETGLGPPGLERSLLTLESTSGLRVDVGLLAPAGGAGRHPAVLLLAGNAAGERSIDEAPDAEGVVTLALGYGYVPPEGAGPFRDLLDVPRARRALMDVVPGALLAHEYLLGRKDVAPSRVALVGVSFGALYVPVVAAQDRRFAAAVMVEGGGDLASLLRGNLALAGAPLLARPGGWLGARLLRPLEPLRYAGAVSPTPLVMINAASDVLVPRANAEALFAAAAEPKEIVWLQEEHVHTGDRRLLERVAEAVRAALLRHGILRPRDLLG